MGNTSIGLIGILVIIGIFFLCRELMCWYWKINRSIENQEKIISLLQQLTSKQLPAPPPTTVSSGSGYESFVGKQVEVIQKNGLKLVGQVVKADVPDEYLALFTTGVYKRHKDYCLIPSTTQLNNYSAMHQTRINKYHTRLDILCKIQS